MSLNHCWMNFLQLGRMKIYVDKSQVSGRGVFTSNSIKKGDIIETAPFILIKSGETPNYSFAFDKNQDMLIFGYGSLYNHSKTPNVYYQDSDTEKSIDFIATKDIKKNQELLINYGNGWWEDRREN